MDTSIFKETREYRSMTYIGHPTYITYGIKPINPNGLHKMLKNVMNHKIIIDPKMRTNRCVHNIIIFTTSSKLQLHSILGLPQTSVMTMKVMHLHTPICI